MRELSVISRVTSSRARRSPGILLAVLVTLAALAGATDLGGVEPGNAGHLVGLGKASEPGLPHRPLRAGETGLVLAAPVPFGPEGGESPADWVERDPGKTSGLGHRHPLDQAGCSVCLTGSASVQWNGDTGSFRVDHVVNGRSVPTGPLELMVRLTSTHPVWGQPFPPYWNLSDTLSLPSLPAGSGYDSVNSGTVTFYGSSILPGDYDMLLYLRENVSGIWFYADWIQYAGRVSCNGSGCSASSACVENATTMCLVGGRYKVTSYWKNQYAGGVESTLNRATLTDATGAFWLFDADTYEYLIRINTATDNGRAWISIPTFTDVEFFVTVQDVVGGQSKTYHSPAGNKTLIYDPSFFVYP